MTVIFKSSFSSPWVTTRQHINFISRVIRVLILLVGLATTPIAGQDEFYTNYTIQDGLISNHVYSIDQDTNGIMWVATDNGLCSFDGFQFECFGKELGLNNLEFLSINFDNLGRLWISTQSKSPMYFQDGQIHSLDSISHSNDLNIFSAFQINEDEIFITGINQILDVKSLKVKPHKKMSPVDIARLKYGNFKGLGNLLNNRLAFFNTNTSRFEITTTEINNSVIPDERIPFLTQYNDVFDQFQPIKSGRQFENERTLLARTQNGLLVIDILSKTKDYKCLLPGINTYCAFRDRENNIWIGSKNHGLFIYHPNLLRTNTSRSSVSQQLPYFIKEINAIDGKIYAYSERENLTILNSKLEIEDALDFDKSKQIVKIEKWNDKLLLLFSNELQIRTLKLSKLHTINIQLSRASLKHMSVIDKNALVVFTNRAHIIHNDHIYKTLEFTPAGRVTSSMQFDDSTILFGTLQGLCALNTRPTYKIETLSNLTIQYLLKKDENSFWAASILGGIQRMDLNGKQVNIVQEWQPPNGIINDVKLLDNNLFVTTNVGVYKLDTSTLSIENFFPSTGNSIINSVDKIGDQLILTSGRTIQLVNEKDLAEDELGTVLVNELLVDNKKYETDSTIRLEYNQNDIVIQYSFPEFTYNQVEFEYRLLPNKTVFSAANSRSTTFVNLPPNDYTFEIWATSLVGEKSQVSSISFEIKLPWWRKWWFYLACFLTGLGIIGYFIQQSRIKQRARLQLIQQRLSALHAQMNPHFLFNALQSLQYYITTKDTKKANKYLSAFSKLVRKTLESSAYDYILIKDEIEYLKSYLILEQDKFEDMLEFEFQINNDESLSKAIPSMVIQPFIENAIIHGFEQNNELKKLVVKFIDKGDNSIKCIITDNGKGITDTDNKPQNHKSYASTAVENKLNLLRQLRSTDISKDKINIKILNNETIKSPIFVRGTTVILELPILNRSSYERP